MKSTADTERRRGTLQHLVFCLFSILLVVSGCATTTTRAPLYIKYGDIVTKRMHIEDKIPLKVAVYIPKEERAKTHKFYVQRYGFTFVVKTGEILEKSSLPIFKEFILDPVLVTEKPDSSEFDALIIPIIEDYSYNESWTWVKTRFFPIEGHIRQDMQGNVTTRLVLTDSAGREIWSDVTSVGLEHTSTTKNKAKRLKSGNTIYTEFIVNGLQEMAGRMCASRKVKEYVANVTKEKSGTLATYYHPGESVKPGDAGITKQHQIPGVSQPWAVIIGISKYMHAGKNGLSNLIFADDDAKAFAGVLRNLGWSESHIKLLINEEATERNIKIALESWLTKAGPNDQIVLFWAGHGYPDPEDPEKVYFACYDTDISIPATGYRMDKVRAALEEKKARNVVLLADTCHAGKLITRGDRGISIVPQIDKMRREQKIPKGWIFMVGADTDRKAIEHTSWTNGAFTHCLLNALSGKADGYLSSGAKDGIVTMGELRTYINTVMPDETQKVLGVAKRPIITTSTGDPDIWNLTFQAK